MRQDESHIGQNVQIRQSNIKSNSFHNEDFVLEKTIFNNIFEKDIRRVFIYKKSERLAKAIALIAPAFQGNASLKNRMDAIAVELVDAAVAPPALARGGLSRALLALSSALSMARTSGILSPMNAELIAREARILLQEVAGYEDPRLSLEETPTLSDLSKMVRIPERLEIRKTSLERAPKEKAKPAVKDISDTHIKDRREAIMSVIRNKDKASIKDISMLVREVSEKTIQRELLSLIQEGTIKKEGERRWSTYSLA